MINYESLICEETAYFTVGKTFYRPHSKITKDLGVLAAKVYKQTQEKLRVLDVMTGCGVRSIRYYLESDADYIWSNDSNPENKKTIEYNLGFILQENKGKISYQNANNIFFECYNNKDYYDLVDVDAFGSPNPYLSTALWATKIGGLIYLTCTDGRTGTGHLPEKCLQVYGSYGRSHPAAQEQVLRLIIGSALQQAATMGLGIEPIFSFFTGQNYRKIKKQLIIDIAEARIKELAEIIIDKNINTKSFRNKNTPIFLMIKDQIVSEKLKNSLKFFFIDEKYSDKNIIKNYVSQELYDNAFNLVQFGWKKEVVPVIQEKKSIISRFFSNIFK